MKINAPENYRKDASWANMFDEFLNTPPTASLFRLYLISFIIWNKAVLLYIIFDHNSMGTKLLVDSWKWYVLFGWYSKTCATISLYFGPIIVLAVLAGISLVNFGKQEKFTIFNWFKKLHIKRVAEIYALEKEVEEEKGAVIEQKEQNIDREVKLNNKIEDIYKSAPAPGHKNKKWIEDYDYFKRTSHFSLFSKVVQELFYDKRNIFTKYGPFDINAVKLNALIDFLEEDSCLNVTNEKDGGYEVAVYNFNEKGEFFIRYYEFEKQNGLTRESIKLGTKR